MFAIIKTGGKQYKVKEGDILQIEQIENKVGERIVFDQVLLVFDEKNDKIEVGQPLVKNARVEARVLAHGKREKIKVIKYKPKVRYHKKIGHRQPYTKVEIAGIKI